MTARTMNSDARHKPGGREPGKTSAATRRPIGTSPGQRGFTLIEVMVALVIVALSLGAIIAAISQMADAATTMRQRTYANWIGHNKITELRLANVVPEVSESDGEVTFAGRDWLWNVSVSETGVENLFRVDVVVSLAASGAAIRTVTGFIGEPVQPGIANAAWSNLGGGTGNTDGEPAADDDDETGGDER